MQYVNHTAEIKDEFKQAVYRLNYVLSNSFMSHINPIAEDIIQHLYYLGHEEFKGHLVEDLPNHFWLLNSVMKQEIKNINHLVNAQSSDRPYFGEDLQMATEHLITDLSELANSVATFTSSSPILASTMVE